jgi:hypothetical protein
MNKKDGIRIPDFVCIGVQKGGTTTLHDILKEHPSIYLPEDKEAPFFNNADNYSKGLKWWNEHYFKKYNNEPLMGVMTPEYIYFDEIPELIKGEFGKDVKLIAVLRHPVDRAYSHYLMTHRRGHEKESFQRGIELENERIKKGEFERHHFSYMSRGHYLDQVKRYQSNFDRENILYLCFESDIRQNIDRTIERILNFIGAEQIALNTSQKSNAASEPRSEAIRDAFIKQSPIKNLIKRMLGQKTRQKIRNWILSKNQKELKSSPKLDAETRNKLFETHYKDELSELEEITGLSLKHWREHK